MVRSHIVSLVLFALMAAPGGVGAQEVASSPPPSEAPLPSSTPPPERVGFEPIPLVPGTGVAPGGLPWRPALGALPEGAWLGRLMTWSGGFAVIESANHPNGDSLDTALWHSPDGGAWVRSPLPSELTYVWRLVADGDGLVMADAGPPWLQKSVHVRLWRSSDAVGWQRAGTFIDRLRANDRADWDINAHDLLVVDDDLVLLTSITRFQAGSGGWSPVGPQLAVAGAQAMVAAERPERMTAWTTRDGTRWTGRRVSGVRDPDGTTSLGVSDSGPLGFLAIHDGAVPSVLTSTDGRRWTRLAALPADWECCGGGALFWSGDTVILASDSDKEEGHVSCGNRLGVWRLEQGGAWEEVVDRQASVTYGAASDGATVILTGQGWCTAPDWGWILVSLDGGRTWEPDLSWTGRSGTCASDVAIGGGVAVMVGCASGGPSIWRAALATPDGAFEPSTTAEPRG